MVITEELMYLVYGRRTNKDYIRTKTILLNQYKELFGLNTKKNLARYLAQTKHELYISSKGNVKIRESLNYRASSLKRFSKSFRNNPKKLKHAMYIKGIAKQKYIAMEWYGRGKKAKILGNKTPYDGWFYRGLGDLQVTGRYNIHKCFRIVEKYTKIKCFISNEVDPKLMNSYKGSILVSMGFWSHKKIYNCSSTKCVINKINKHLPEKERRKRLNSTYKILELLDSY